MRFHVLGLNHTISSHEMLACAYTQKVVKFIDMMRCTPEQRQIRDTMSTEEIVKHKTIHYLIHYGHERSVVNADEHVTVVTDAVWKKTYGDYDWKKSFFKFSDKDYAHTYFNSEAIINISKRMQNGDFLLCFWGAGHGDINNMFKHICIAVEPGIGYGPGSSCHADFKVFESFGIMHTFYGETKRTHPANYDCVIPNYFDPKDFEFKEEN